MCVLRFECFYISERSNVVILSFSREENITDIFFDTLRRKQKHRKELHAYVTYSDSLLFFIKGIFLVSINIELLFSVLFFFFMILLNILNLLWSDFGYKILKFCFGFRFVLILPPAGHYGLKWTGHMMTRFGQSDCSISKTRNPSDNKSQ